MRNSKQITLARPLLLGSVIGSFLSATQAAESVPPPAPKPPLESAAAAVPPVLLKPPVAKDAKEGAFAWMEALGNASKDAKALRAKSSLPFWISKLNSGFETDDWRKAGCQRVTVASTDPEWDKLARCLGSADLNTSVQEDEKDASGKTVGEELYYIYFPDLAAFKKSKAKGISISPTKAEMKRLEALASTHAFVHFYTGARPSYTYLLAIRYAKPDSHDTLVSAMLVRTVDEGR